MTARRITRFSLWAALLLAVACVCMILFWRYLPYQNAAAARIRAELAAYGLEVTSLEVESADNTHASLKNIELGKEKPLHIGQLRAAYRLPELLEARIDELKLTDVSLRLYKDKSAWRLGGLEPLMDSPPSASPPFYWDAAAIRARLPTLFSLDSGTLSVSDAPLSLQLPFSLSSGTSQEISLSLKSSGITAALPPYALTGGALDASAKFDEKKRQWNGIAEWRNLAFTGLPQPVPPLHLTARFSADEKTLSASGKLKSANNSWKTDFTFRLPANGTAQLSISNLSFPWAGGHISVEAVRIPLKPGPINVPLRLTRVDMGTLLAMAGEGKVSATGSISGLFPIQYLPGGTLRFEPGEANADGEGTLSLSPDALPVSGATQMDEVKRALQNFHYSSLKIRVSSDADNNPSAQLTVEGFSPDAWEGKHVKLNINLAGDLLPLLKQSLLPMNDPRQLLKSQE